MDRLSALEQSIYVEAELAQLFNSFAIAFYKMPDVQELWERLAKGEAAHVLMLEFEKWRIVREELGEANVSYDDQALLLQMKKFDDMRGAIVHPLEFIQAIEIAVKAEESAMDFHDDRIFMEDVGVSDTVVQAIVEMEEKHRETLDKLASASDPVAAVKKIELAGLEEVPSE